jgi:hypothetical protein
MRSAAGYFEEIIVNEGLKRTAKISVHLGQVGLSAV